MKETFIWAWKRDWNFRITMVFFVLWFLDLALTGSVRAWIAVPYFTSIVYGIIKMFVGHRAFRKFMKRQDELHVMFNAATKKDDVEEMGRVLKLLGDSLKEYEGGKRERDNS